MARRRSAPIMVYAVFACGPFLVGQGCPAQLRLNENKGTGLVVTPPENDQISTLDAILGSKTLPPAVDLSRWLPPAGDQGEQDSCVGWSLAFALKTFHEAKERGWDPAIDTHQFSPSYLFNRVNRGCSVGASLRDALQLLVEEGCDTLASAPYNPLECSSHLGDAATARLYRIQKYNMVAVKKMAEVKAYLAAEMPVVIGITLYPQFKDLNPSQPVYNSDAGDVQGQHVVVAIGYDDDLQAVKVFNSYGRQWGDDGYGWILYDLWEKVVILGYVAYDRIDGLSPNEATVTDPIVTFHWQAVPEATSYLLQIRQDPALGSDEGTIVNEIAPASVTQYEIDLAAALSTVGLPAAGTNIYWAVQPRFQSRPNEWIGPASFTFRPAKRPVPPDQVEVALSVAPTSLVADGKASVAATAAVTRWDTGAPVADEQVRFTMGHYVRAPSGQILGPADTLEVGLNYESLPSGGYQGGAVPNVINARTDSAGRATVQFVPPVWADYMADRPHRLTAWYLTDGGGNPSATVTFNVTRP